MRHKKNIFAAVLAVVFAGLVIVSNINNVLAQNTATGPGNGFRISPVRYELIVQKGTSQTVKMRIENPTNSLISTSIIINDFEPNDNESGEPKILFDANTSAKSNSFKSIASTLKTIDIGAGAKVEIDVVINVPENAEAGGYYGAIRAVPNNEADKNISLSASVGTLFLVQVPGNLTESLVLKEFSAAKNDSLGRFFINSGNMSIVTRIENTGNIHVKPFGKVQVLDRSGKVVQEYEFNNKDPRGNILPKSIRKFDDKLKDQKWFGKYSIVANLGYGSSGGLITAKNTFWVIPAWFIAVVGALLLIILIGLYLVYRKFIGSKKHLVNTRR